MLLEIRRSFPANGGGGGEPLHQQYMQTKYHAFLTVHTNKKMSQTGLLLWDVSDTKNFENCFFLFTIPAHTS